MDQPGNDTVSNASMLPSTSINSSNDVPIGEIIPITNAIWIERFQVLPAIQIVYLRDFGKEHIDTWYNHVVDHRAAYPDNTPQFLGLDCAHVTATNSRYLLQRMLESGKVRPELIGLHVALIFGNSMIAQITTSFARSVIRSSHKTIYQFVHSREEAIRWMFLKARQWDARAQSTGI